MNFAWVTTTKVAKDNDSTNRQKAIEIQLRNKMEEILLKINKD